MLSGFREFIMRGNVVDLAVAVVIGAAFGALITSFVGDVLTPLLGVFGSRTSRSSLSPSARPKSATARS